MAFYKALALLSIREQLKKFAREETTRRPVSPPPDPGKDRSPPEPGPPGDDPAREAHVQGVDALEAEIDHLKQAAEALGKALEALKANQSGASQSPDTERPSS